VKTDGTLWSAGFNLRGQLGDGTTTATNQPIQVADGAMNVAGGCLFSLFSKTDGTLWSIELLQLRRLGIVYDGGGRACANPVLCKVVASVKSVPTSSHVLAIGEPLAAVTVSTHVGRPSLQPERVLSI
jgi:hypothetical protein